MSDAERVYGLAVQPVQHVWRDVRRALSGVDLVSVLGLENGWKLDGKWHSLASGRVDFVGKRVLLQDKRHVLEAGVMVWMMAKIGLDF